MEIIRIQRHSLDSVRADEVPLVAKSADRRVKFSLELTAAGKDLEYLEAIYKESRGNMPLRFAFVQDVLSRTDTETLRKLIAWRMGKRLKGN